MKEAHYAPFSIAKQHLVLKIIVLNKNTEHFTRLLIHNRLTDGLKATKINRKETITKQKRLTN